MTKSGLIKIAKDAQKAARQMVNIPSETKNAALADMAAALIDRARAILKANELDITKARSARLEQAFIDRLALNDARIREMAASLRQIAKLADPVGETIKEWAMPNGLRIRKARVPIGVIAIIYESRPNVTSDCAGLCLKSGNAVILRGGSESINSNLAIFETLKSVLKKHTIPEAALNLIATSDRKAVDELLKLNEYIDLVMPRGGEGLIKRVVDKSRIPVIKHYKGICHVYVDEWADLQMAGNICFNAKVQRPGVCNAMECMLVNKHVAQKFLPAMLKRFKDAGVEIRGCGLTRKLVQGVKKATLKDFRSEYLDLILSVKVVDDMQAALRHINEFGTHHSDSIISENPKSAELFLKGVDSACVFVNASTRFTDGGQFGMGAEIGISTDKLHARGPMGLEELTTYKYEITGNGQVRG